MTENPDLVIRGGNIADGRGGDLFEADIAIKDGRIADVGKVSARGKEEIDARGRLVTPFCDDGVMSWLQVTWPS